MVRKINENAAGIDIGSRSHFVAIKTGEVREYSSYTSSLEEMALWLKESGVETIAMESTGVYWIPAFELLESKGFDVNLVDAKQAKNMPGRKTDVSDCQWIQELHSFGLLTSAFRPNDQITALRSLVRQKDNLIKQSSTEILHMQKALEQMNIKLTNVLRFITGQTGMKIIRAIVKGERDPLKLAEHRHKSCKRSKEEIAEALKGNFREEHLFSLKQSLAAYDFYQKLIKECEAKISNALKKLSKLKKKIVKNTKDISIKEHLVGITGVDLTAVNGIGDISALIIVSEIGDVSKFKSEKHFASWLGLCPGSKKSGGKVLSGKTKNVTNRITQTLKMAANSLYRSQSALGAYFRRMKFRKGVAKAITATAHKIAKIIYNMLKFKKPYTDPGIDKYEKNIKMLKIKKFNKLALELGIDLSEKARDSLNNQFLSVIQ